MDLSDWLSPLDGGNPSGEDLRRDPRFDDIKRLITPDTNLVEAEQNDASRAKQQPADWAGVLAIAEDMRRNGRDLRLLVLVAQARINQDGLRGLVESLQLIAATAEGFWDTMHPMLRAGASGREAALPRLNALAQLQNGGDGILRDLRGLVLFAPRAIGPVTGRDLERGAMDDYAVQNDAPSGLGTADRARLLGEHQQLLNRVRAGCAAMADQAPAELAALTADAAAALAALDALDRTVNARTGGGGTTVPELKRFLERVSATLSQGSQSAAPAAPGEAREEGGQAAAPGPAGTNAAAGGAVRGAIPGMIGSREEVVKLLDLVIAFYDRTEPSSPIPHLVRRVRRMVPMDFLQLMEDLAPSGLKEFRTVAGVAEGKK